MASAFDRIADLIAETSDVPRDKITPDSHVINDLGIDSLDFLDIVFAIDKEFGIKVPVEAWTQEVNAGRAPAENFFVMKNLAIRVEELVAAKPAPGA
jgi:acyl carrier protein